MVGDVYVGYINMMSMPILNVFPSIYPSNAVNHLQLNNHNSLNSNVNLNRNIFNNFLIGLLSTDAVNLGQIQLLIGR